MNNGRLIKIQDLTIQPHFQKKKTGHCRYHIKAEV